MPRYKKGEWSGMKQKILLLHVEGKQQKEIAEILDKNPSTVCEHMQSPEFARRKEKLEIAIQEKVRNRFASQGMRAAEKILQLMETGSGHDRLKFDAAKEVLYQIGCKPTEVIETRTRDYTPQEINSAMLVMKEVETITQRLSTKRSPFIIEKKEEVIEDKTGETTPSAPCPSDVTDSTQKEESNE